MASWGSGSWGEVSQERSVTHHENLSLRLADIGPKKKKKTHNNLDGLSRVNSGNLSFDVASYYYYSCCSSGLFLTERRGSSVVAVVGMCL